MVERHLQWRRKRLVFESTGNLNLSFKDLQEGNFKEVGFFFFEVISSANKFLLSRRGEVSGRQRSFLVWAKSAKMKIYFLARLSESIAQGSNFTRPLDEKG